MSRRLTLASLVSLGSVCITLAACGDAAAPVALADACFEVPQALVASNAVQGNGVDDNRIAVNGLTLNGGYMNGIALNGQYLNGVDASAALSVRLDGGRLVVERAGVRLDDDALVGASFPAGTRKDAPVVRIEAVIPDDSDPRFARYVLTLDGASVCGEGFEEGAFVAGSFDDTGRYHPDASGATASFTCANGVMSKCLAWGYKPWTTSDDAYQTCTRLARADYCGDGVPWTQNGTLIDVYDGFGVQERAEGLAFEAGWSVDGAVCVAEPRYDVRDARGDAVRPACWDALPRCGSLEQAEAIGALIANDSEHTSLVACE